ncbi:MAG: sensor histidine kinase [Lachnospiraceae bacterium]
MEKRKVIGLRGYFTRSMLLALLGAFAIVIGSLLIGNYMIVKGHVLRANAGETAAKAAMQELNENEIVANLTGTEPYEYIQFDEHGNVLASSLSGNAIEEMLAKYADMDASYTNAEYIFLEDGSYWLFSWKYTAMFANPKLRLLFPPAEIMFFIALFLSLGIFFLAYVSHISRRFSSSIEVVTATSEQIAEQELDTPISITSGIKEFDNALSSMEQMRQALKDSLSKQWSAEQQRRQEVAALAHDIKTPLTIISGNTELLMEDRLTEEQINLTESIHSAAKRAQEYIALLQQVSAMDAEQESPGQVTIDFILGEVRTALAPFAVQKQVLFETSDSRDLVPVTVFGAMLTRALINIGENAIRYTPENGRVVVDVMQNSNTTAFIITDGGNGFSQEALKHAKEMFWQDDKSRSGNGNFGMGLAIAAKAAETHNGKLMIENCDRGGRVIFEI